MVRESNAKVGIYRDASRSWPISNEESAYLKKCKHFIMVVNYIREQLELGLIIQVLKIKGKLNNADLHTKKLRDKSFAVKADISCSTLHE